MPCSYLKKAYRWALILRGNETSACRRISRPSSLSSEIPCGCRNRIWSGRASSHLAAAAVAVAAMMKRLGLSHANRTVIVKPRRLQRAGGRVGCCRTGCQDDRPELCVGNWRIMSCTRIRPERKGAGNHRLRLMRDRNSLSRRCVRRATLAITSADDEWRAVASLM